MITTKRWLLYTSNESIICELEKFEAVKRVHDVSEVEEVWKLNKTPILKTDAGCVPNTTFDVLEVPFYKVPFGEGQKKEFTLWCYSMEFEPGEYREGIEYDTRTESCVLCSLVGHKAISSNTIIYNSDVRMEDMILYESSNFIVVPELGSIKPGYLMIVPKQHEFLSMAQLPSLYLGEYEQVCEDVEIMLEGAFHEKVTFFEHGSSPSGRTSHKKSIVHAHVHAVAGFVLKDYYLKMIQMQPCPDLSVAKDTHYFAYKEGAHGQRLCCYDDNVYVQRQFPRQVMAIELGYDPELYNWRTTAFKEHIMTTLYRIYKYLSTSPSLSYRLKDRTKCFVLPYKDRMKK